MVVAQRDTAVNMSEALEKAKDALQSDGWTLESSERDENEFEFEFVMNGTNSEAEVTVSVRSGDIISVREETDNDDDIDDVREDERMDEDSDDERVDDTDNVTSLEEARKRIAALEARIERLQREIRRLRAA
jgi:uncharacterized small protein (DUF1192 family)